MAVGPRRDPPSGRFTCSYRYRLISPRSELAYWRPARMLARFAGADLGQFARGRRLEQAWLAIRRAGAEVARPQIAAGTPFAVFLTLGYPRGMNAAADPELVKALIDAAAAAFQAHGDRAGLGEIAGRVAAATGQPPGAIAGMLADDRRAGLGVPYPLAPPRGARGAWDPGGSMWLGRPGAC